MEAVVTGMSLKTEATWRLWVGTKPVQVASSLLHIGNLPGTCCHLPDKCPGTVCHCQALWDLLHLASSLLHLSKVFADGKPCFNSP